MAATVSTVTNGRESTGRFGSGNRFARNRCNPAVELRQAFVDAVTPEDVAEIAQAMVKKAAEGNVQCAKLVLERCIGKVVAVQDDSDQAHDESRNRVLSFVENQADAT